MSTILIGVDDSPSTEDALAFARPLAAASGATVVLAHAFPYDDTPSRFSNREYRAILEEQAEQTLRQVASQIDGIEPERVKTIAVASTSPPRALDELARSARAELIVLGSTHTGPLRRIVPGSTAERLLHGAPCPVAVVPHGYRPPAGNQQPLIGVAYDGFKESVAALHAATRVARGLDGRLRIIRVFDPTDYATPPLRVDPTFEEQRAQIRRDAQADLERTAAELPRDLHAEAVFAVGDVVRELAKQSVELHLLMAGSRAYGPIRSVLLGGATGRLIREVACAFIVVPRGDETPFSALFGEYATAAS